MTENLKALQSQENINEVKETLDVSTLCQNRRVDDIRGFCTQSCLLQAYLEEAEGFEKYYVESLESSGHILDYLDKIGADSAAIIRNELKSTHLSYQT